MVRLLKLIESKERKNQIAKSLKRMEKIIKGTKSKVFEEFKDS